MTNEQLNRLCAEKVMGWKQKKNCPWWCEKDGSPTFAYVIERDVENIHGEDCNWNPCEDISDAWMLTRKVDMCIVPALPEKEAAKWICRFVLSTKTERTKALQLLVNDIVFFAKENGIKIAITDTKKKETNEESNI